MRSAADILIVGGAEFRANLSDDVATATRLRVMELADVDAVHALVRAEAPSASVALIDLGMPDNLGLKICTELVGALKGVRVIMVGADDSEAAALRSLEAGAIDHFTRPDNRSELLARVRAHLRSLETSMEVEIALGPFIFRPGQRTLFNRRTQERIWLTVKEVRLLRCLHLADSKPVSSALLFAAGWGSPDASMQTLHTHVYRLRTKLGAGGDGSPRVETVEGGYVLVY